MVNPAEQARPPSARPVDSVASGLPDAGQIRFRSVGSAVWALIPVFTFGIGAPFTISFAAFRLHSKGLAWCAALYAVAVFGAVYLATLSTSETDWRSNFAGAMLLAVMAIATAQSFALRSRLFRQPSASDLALDDAERGLRLRRESRHLVETNPKLAVELRVGRPDLPRRYDDGGLVDVNHAPASFLAQFPGVTPTTADQIVSVRDGIGGFESVDDLSNTIGLAPQSLDEAADYLVFLR